MAAVSRTDLSKAEHDELSCVFAALILHDEGVEVTADKIQKLVSASGNDIEKYWPLLFANALKGQDISRLLSNFGSGSASSAPATTSAPSGETKTEEKKEDKKEEAEEEVLDGGMDLFGGDEW
ncbi:unnamed protein product [Blepharisma stoltei]|uniref:60S acidic ribosomal protein P1 n=1 Tax=Blepharisma stoltei TaxID=1481888 RepID=A0AAU9K9S2_9CILI|nr:unnamed protein product [Blepharisma stoltei]